MPSTSNINSPPITTMPVVSTIGGGGVRGSVDTGVGVKVAAVGQQRFADQARNHKRKPRPQHPWFGESVRPGRPSARIRRLDKPVHRSFIWSRKHHRKVNQEISLVQLS